MHQKKKEQMSIFAIIGNLLENGFVSKPKKPLKNFLKEVAFKKKMQRNYLVTSVTLALLEF